MSKAAHTPTPWSKDKFNGINDKDGFGLFDGQDILVLHNWEEKGAMHWNEKPGETYREISDDEAEANAEFVVKAVNHHDELRTRLYNLKNAVETTMPVLKCSPEVSMCLIETNETLKKVI